MHTVVYPTLFLYRILVQYYGNGNYSSMEIAVLVTVFPTKSPYYFMHRNDFEKSSQCVLLIFNFHVNMHFEETFQNTISMRKVHVVMHSLIRDITFVEETLIVSIAAFSIVCYVSKLRVMSNINLSHSLMLVNLDKVYLW
jgi:hypothetical protein